SPDNQGEKHGQAGRKNRTYHGWQRRHRFRHGEAGREGRRLRLSHRRREPETAAAVKEIGRNVTGVQGDVSDLGDLDRLFAQIRREKGRLDIVFVTAGVAKYARLGEITEDFYDSIFNINVKGLLFTVQKALPLMPDGASIILNASIVASKGFSSNSVYSATKAAVRSFAWTWTTDLKDRRIRVNAVSPGPIETPGLSDLLASSETGQQRKKMIFQ